MLDTSDNRIEVTGQTTTPKLERKADTQNHNLMGQNPRNRNMSIVINKLLEAQGGKARETGTPGGRVLGGTPEVLPPRALTSSHSKDWRKIPSASFRGRVK